jgi:hypothetical protein
MSFAQGCARLVGPADVYTIPMGSEDGADCIPAKDVILIELRSWVVSVSRADAMFGQAVV